jgi:SnoaL-like protein
MSMTTCTKIDRSLSRAVTPVDILQTALAALNERNISRAVDQFAHDFTFNDYALDLEFRDKGRLTEFFQKACELFPDTVVELVSTFESGDYAIAEWKLTATQIEQFGSRSYRFPIVLRGSTIVRRVVSQYQHRGLDVSRHAGKQRPGLDHQGSYFPRSQLEAPHRHRRRDQHVCQRAGLVLGVWLAADLRRFAANLPVAGLCLVLCVHQPLHPRLRNHDRRRCPEVLHATPQARAHHRRHVPLYPPPQLSRRDDDLRQLRLDGVALATFHCASLDLGRVVCG